jgi:hypothetical protein
LSIHLGEGHGPILAIGKDFMFGQDLNNAGILAALVEFLVWETKAVVAAVKSSIEALLVVGPAAVATLVLAAAGLAGLVLLLVEGEEEALL